VNKGQQEFLLDVVEKPEDLVKLYGKAYDLRGRSLLAIMRIKEAAPEILQALHCMGNVAVLRTIEELEEKLAGVAASEGLRRALCGAGAPASGSKPERLESP